MPSPFPGIDPYLESQHYWSDFHHTFINYCRESLNDRLPDQYVARIDERVNLVDVSHEEAKHFLPDVSVVQYRQPSAVPSPGASGALTMEPVTIPVAYLEEETEVYIEILHRQDRRLVAALEVLSPGNKSEPGRTAYLIKRNALLREPVHLVELDFLAGGRRLPMDRPLPAGDYFAFVARGDRRPDCEVYAWPVRRPLPTIRVPLTAPDHDIPLDLQAVFTTTYERGRYARSIDYHAPLTVPLAAENRAWAEGLAKAAR